MLPSNIVCLSSLYLREKVNKTLTAIHGVIALCCFWRIKVSMTCLEIITVSLSAMTLHLLGSFLSFLFPGLDVAHAVQVEIDNYERDDAHYFSYCSKHQTKQSTLQNNEQPTNPHFLLQTPQSLRT